MRDRIPGAVWARWKAYFRVTSWEAEQARKKRR